MPIDFPQDRSWLFDLDAGSLHGDRDVSRYEAELATYLLRNDHPPCLVYGSKHASILPFLWFLLGKRCGVRRPANPTLIAECEIESQRDYARMFHIEDNT